jgi:hypothetical protein
MSDLNTDGTPLMGESPTSKAFEKAWDSTLANDVFHHSDPSPAKVTVSVEKNTKGYNWSASVSGAASVDEAMKMLTEAESALRKKYGEPLPVLPNEIDRKALGDSFAQIFDKK